MLDCCCCPFLYTVKPHKGCGRKNTPIWEGHSFGCGGLTVVGSTSSNSGIRAIFSVHHGVVGRTSSLYCWGVYKKWRVSWTCYLLAWWYRVAVALARFDPLRFFSLVLPQSNGLWTTPHNFGSSEGVAAITPEIILRVMDNYRERLHQCINIQGRHLSDVLFKTHWCKTAFCVLSGNRKTFAVSSLVFNLFASQIGEFFLLHPVFSSLECAFDHNLHFPITFSPHPLSFHCILLERCVSY